MKKNIFLVLAMAAFMVAIIFYFMKPVDVSDNQDETVSIKEDERNVAIPTPMSETSTVESSSKNEAEAKSEEETKPALSDLGRFCQDNPQEFIKQRLDNLFQQYGSTLVDQIELINLEFIKESQPFRLQLSIDESANGKEVQNISFFSLDRESLPVREKLPEEFANKSWDEITSLIQQKYRITWQEDHHLMITPEGNQIRAVQKDSQIIQYEDQSVVCRDGKCSCYDL